MKSIVKHPIEAKDSFASYLERNEQQEGDGSEDTAFLRQGHRNLKHHESKQNKKLELLAEKRENEFLEQQRAEQQAKQEKYRKKHEAREAELLRDSGIQEETNHGMMIDAGSGGSRLHLFEWEPRVLHNPREVDAAVSGKKLTYPGTDTRWTDRLSPGLSDFATLPDDELQDAVSAYLAPFIDFAATILSSKEEHFARFPIFLRATAGMRVIEQSDRFRVMAAVRNFFNNETANPFQFVDEQARVISGEEEAIYGWTGINFAMGNLVEESEGSGTVLNPRLTYGALDMGGASTQISFYEPNGDIMSNLFKLQIGQGKHWNLYAHSFLHYGINEAKDRLEARLINDKDATARLSEGVYNPCLPGGAEKTVRTDIYFDSNGYETWNHTAADDAAPDGFRQALIKNTNKGGDGNACMALAKDMLHKSQNEWCNYSHRGDCSFAGVYQPDLPQQSQNFGEFLAFSNFYHVWDFLNLPMRSSLADLKNQTLYACSLSQDRTVGVQQRTHR